MGNVIVNGWGDRSAAVSLDGAIAVSGRSDSAPAGSVGGAFTEGVPAAVVRGWGKEVLERTNRAAATINMAPATAM